MTAAFKVYLGGKRIDTVFFDSSMTAEQVKRSLVSHDGYSPRIRVTKVKKANPSGGRTLTKLEKKVRAAKKAADRRVAVALAKYLRRENPGKKVVGAKVVKGKGGKRTITPIFGTKKTMDRGRRR